MLAGIDLQTGEAIPLVRDKHSSKEYIEFLKLLNAKYPEKDKIRLVLDNLKVHSSEETRKYLATVPGRFEFVFTPKHGSWLNLIEGEDLDREFREYKTVRNGGRYRNGHTTRKKDVSVHVSVDFTRPRQDRRVLYAF